MNESVPKRISLVKLGIFSSIFFLGFWIFIAAIFIPRLFSVSTYSLPQISDEAAILCKSKIRKIYDIKYNGKTKIVVSEKELNSFLYTNYLISGINDPSIKILSDGLNVIFTLTPLKNNILNSLFDKYIFPPIKVKYLQLLKNYLRKLKLCVGIKMIFGIDKKEEFDFTFKAVSIGTIQFPAKLITVIAKYFIPQYKVLFSGLLGAKRIHFTNKAILFTKE